MSVQYVMPNGEVVPVPPDVLSQGNAAQQAFYDNQVARIAAEKAETAAPPAGEGSNS